MTKRKSDPNWPNHKGQSLAERRQRVAATAQRRNEVAKTMGYPNSGAFLTAVCNATDEIRAQIRLLLPPTE